MVKQIVLPIKDSNVLKQVEDTLLNNFRFGRRNYTIFQAGKATLLRVSDVLALRYDDFFDTQGQVKKNAYIHDQKTGKVNTLYLRPVATILLTYQQWLVKNNLVGKWLFPSVSRPTKHLDQRQYYQIMRRVGDLLEII